MQCYQHRIITLASVLKRETGCFRNVHNNYISTWTTCIRQDNLQSSCISPDEESTDLKDGIIIPLTSVAFKQLYVFSQTKIIFSQTKIIYIAPTYPELPCICSGIPPPQNVSIYTSCPRWSRRRVAPWEAGRCAQCSHLPWLVDA